MRNENLYTMKQPELGKKISEIRKQKGLTQEELVEQCNINVRTIQRIEAGEVTPRSYTVKAILEVLGVNFDEVIKDEQIDHLKNLSSVKKPIKKLNLAWVFGIVFFLISFVEYPMDFMRMDNKYIHLEKIWYVLVKIISVVSFSLFMYGFVITGKAFKNKLLDFSAILLIVFNVFFVFFDVLSLYFFKEAFIPAGIARLIIFGILGVLIGVSEIQLQKHLGTLALVTAIFKIVASFCIAIVVFAEAYLFLSIPLEILEIILLYMVAKKLGN
ncbi:MAG: helix-turn-helix domain-containing protein [Flavobacteriaceae bacterium]